MYSAVSRAKRKVADVWEFLTWLIAGRKAPAPRLLKRRTVRSYAKQRSLEVLIETGTFEGEMVNSVKGAFRRIVSIELDPTLFDRAQKRFRADSHISIMHGDSGHVLRDILGEIHSGCLFWLDAHYSGGATARGGEETPITSELSSVLERRNKSDVVLIDDARLFTGGAYPTIASLREMFADSHLRTFEVRDDIIRISR